MLFIQGIAAIGVFTVCFVWAMESVSGRWKTFIGMTMNYAWPIGRYEKSKDSSIAWKKQQNDCRERNDYVVHIILFYTLVFENITSFAII